ncbi:MAG: hypothetical protein KDC73_10755 [Ignavibacteriae bacterium]|nr:hypothetical protein [Ignavibacteriota bacterium]MCB9242506.1 hypothetical protein [Ignavibacteriales bacterium]
MRKVISNNLKDNLRIENDVITISGIPPYMNGNMMISNEQDEILFIKEVPLSNSTDVKKGLQLDKIVLNRSIRPGVKKDLNIHLPLPSQTLPGEYETFIDLETTKKKIIIKVEKYLNYKVEPSSFLFQGFSAGKTFTQTCTIFNDGNIPFTLPTLNKSLAFDIDFLCKSLSLALEEKADEGFSSLVDDAIKNVRNHNSMFIGVSLAEAGKVIEPGQELKINITFSIPKDCKINGCIKGRVRFIDQMLNYKFIQ